MAEKKETKTKVIDSKVKPVVTPKVEDKKEKSEIVKENKKEKVVKPNVKKEVKQKSETTKPVSKIKKKVEVPKLEREYVIPLREKCRVVARYKKANKAIKTIKEFLVRHMKIRDRDLKKIKIDKFLNEAVWFRGIRSPPHKIKVKAIKEGDIVRVELAQLTEKLKFKKARLEKREIKATATVDKKMAPQEGVQPKSEVGGKALQKAVNEKAKKIDEEKEKKAAVVEEGQKLEKAMAKEKKHQTAGKPKQPKKREKVASNK